MSIKSGIKTAFFVGNAVAILALAVVIIVQIWFEPWNSWDVIVRVIATYLVVLVAGVAVYHAHDLTAFLFPEPKKSAEERLEEFEAARRRAQEAAAPSAPAGGKDEA